MPLTLPFTFQRHEINFQEKSEITRQAVRPSFSFPYLPGFLVCARLAHSLGDLLTGLRETEVANVPSSMTVARLTRGHLQGPFLRSRLLHYHWRGPLKYG